MQLLFLNAVKPAKNRQSSPFPLLDQFAFYLLADVSHLMSQWKYLFFKYILLTAQCSLNDVCALLEQRRMVKYLCTTALC